jgi:hypothetical protein
MLVSPPAPSTNSPATRHQTVPTGAASPGSQLPPLAMAHATPRALSPAEDSNSPAANRTLAPMQIAPPGAKLELPGGVTLLISAAPPGL